MVPVMPADFEGMLPPPHLGVTVSRVLPNCSISDTDSYSAQPPGEFDPFLDVFDWEDLTGMMLPC
jgi:hypothetical protein